VSEDLPKPMIPVGRFPILWHIMKYYASHGHKEFILCLGYKGHVIKDYFLNYASRTSDFSLNLSVAREIRYHADHDESDWRVTLADTGLDAMTGARVRRIRHYIGEDENFMLTYGDGVGDIDIDKLTAFHLKHKRVLTVTGVHPPGRFGELMGSPDGVVTEFNEKPQATGGRISSGFFVCRRELFDYLDDREELVFETDPMRALVKKKQMMLYEHDGFWQPMDTYRDYAYLNDLVSKQKAPWIVW
jgi:glucose-1-phosphate cytidylyltransferase